jgi:predicted nucleotidyltransferase
MLEIINNLVPFFEDCYRRINVREYAKIANISPPTASKLLAYYHKEGILKKERYRNYIFFYANKDDEIFIDFSRIYWKIKLNEITEFANKKLFNPCIVLFGSLAKAEVKKDSDIDLAVFASKEISFKIFESKLKRKIQVFLFKSLGDIKSKELANNILNGCILGGRLKL